MKARTSEPADFVEAAQEAARAVLAVLDMVGRRIEDETSTAEVASLRDYIASELTNLTRACSRLDRSLSTAANGAVIDEIQAQIRAALSPTSSPIVLTATSSPPVVVDDQGGESTPPDLTVEYDDGEG